MNIELMKALIGLIQQGGMFALGGVFLWGLLQVVKLVLVVYCIKTIANLIYRAYSNKLALDLANRKESMVLLGEDISSHLVQSLEGFQERTEEAMKSFLSESESLLKPLKEKKNLKMNG